MENLGKDIKTLKELYKKYDGVEIKFVINKSNGGYSLSKKAYEHLGQVWSGMGMIYFEDRTNPRLIEVVEKLGEEASNQPFSELEIETITFEELITHCIKNNDGYEEIVPLCEGGERLIEYV